MAMDTSRVSPIEAARGIFEESSSTASGTMPRGVISDKKKTRHVSSFLSLITHHLSLKHMIPVAEAIRIVVEKAEPLAAERVTLDEALGRVLAEDVFADTDLPPFDRAQMDGY